MHSWSKGLLADRIFKLWKSCVCDYQVVKHTFFEILTFNFPNFQTTFVKNSTKKPPGFKIDFESTDKVLSLHQYLWSEIPWQWNNGNLIFFLKFARKSLLFLTFCQKREVLKPQFCWYFWNVLLWIILMEMKVSQVGCFQITGRWICYSIFFDISFTVFFTRLLSKSLWNYPFSAQISKIHFKI